MNHIITTIRTELLNVSQEEDRLIHERLMRPQQGAIRTAYGQLLEGAQEKDLWHALRDKFKELTGRNLNDAILAARAIIKSQRVLLAQRTRALEQSIERSNAHLEKEMARRTGPRAARVDAMRRRIRRLSTRQAEVQQHIAAGTVPAAVFGGRKTWKQVLRRVPAARERWRSLRTDQFISRGARNRDGNPHCRLTTGPDKALRLSIRVPEGLRQQKGRQTTYARWLTFDISYSLHIGRDYGRLLRAAAADGQAKKGQYTVRLLRLAPARYRAYVTLEEPVAHREYQASEPLPEWCTSVGGVDLNLDHLAATVVDRQGQFRTWRALEYPNLGELPRAKSHWRIGNIAQETTDWLEALGVQALVIEDLDIDRAAGSAASLNRRTIPFCYRQLIEALVRAALRRGMVVKRINPAYTSWIGRLKYSRPHGISVHGAASYVIARRGLGLQERLPKDLVAKIPAIAEAVRGSPRTWERRRVLLGRLENWRQYSPEAGHPWLLWATLYAAREKLASVEEILFPHEERRRQTQGEPEGSS